MSCENDPGCLKHYARMRAAKDAMNETLLPSGANVTYVGTVFGSFNVIWYFGKHETGFASGATVEAVVDNIFGKIFGGL